MDTRVGSYAVVRRSDEVLLVRWAVGAKKEWTLPGGGIEPGETAAECVVREVREETGYDVVIDGLLGVHDLWIPVEQRISPGDVPLHLHQVMYAATIVAGDLTPLSDDGNDVARWVPLAEVPTLARVAFVDAALGLIETHENDSGPGL